jgi:hypothetical protein
MAKNSYGRGAGTPLICAPGTEYQAGLCYVPCKSGYYGVGPFCWISCPLQYPQDGGALCCDGPCNAKIVELAQSVLQAVINALIAGEDPTKVINAIEAAIEAILGFVLPLCSDFPPLVNV